MKANGIALVAMGLGLIAMQSGQSSVAASASRWMTETEIRAGFVMRMVAGTLPDGQPWTELMRDDGQTDYMEGGRPLKGRWWFDEHGQLCFRYSTGSGGCFRYIQLSENCYEHFFSATQQPIAGTAVARDVFSNGPLWRQEEPSTCDAKPSV